MNYWQIGIVVYLILIIGSFLPVAVRLLREVELKPGGAGFDECVHFDEEIIKLLKQPVGRISKA